VEAALVKVDGFKSMEADVSKQQVVVQYDPGKAKPEDLVQAINDGTDFTASVL